MYGNYRLDGVVSIDRKDHCSLGPCPGTLGVVPCCKFVQSRLIDDTRATCVLLIQSENRWCLFCKLLFLQNCLFCQYLTEFQVVTIQSCNPDRACFLLQALTF